VEYRLTVALDIDRRLSGELQGSIGKGEASIDVIIEI